MNKALNSCGNSSSVSIWKRSAQNVLSDTNEHEKEQTLVLNFEALRAIGRIVGAIKERIALAPGTGK